MNMFNKLKGTSSTSKQDHTCNQAASNNSKISTNDEFKRQINQLVEETLKSLNIIWTDAGYQEAEKQNLINNLYSTLENTCLNEVQAENDILEHSKKEVENKINEYISLCHDLGRNNISLASVTQTIHSKTTTTDQLAEISKLIENISNEIASRSKILDVEYDSIHVLQNDLGDQSNSIENLPTINADGVILPLSDTRLQQLKKLKLNLESIKTDRIEKMKALMNDIHQLYLDMNIFDELENKKQIVLKNTNEIQMYSQLLKQNIHSNNTSMNNSLTSCSTGSNSLKSYSASQNILPQEQSWEFGVHIDTVKSLEKELIQLTQEKESRRCELATTGAEIARLWTLLRISTVERESFSKSFQMNLSLDTVQKGR